MNGNMTVKKKSRQKKMTLPDNQITPNKKKVTPILPVMFN